MFYSGVGASVFGLVGYGLIDSTGNRLSVPPESRTPLTIVVSRQVRSVVSNSHHSLFRSHAGKVKDLASQAFGDKYTVEPAGGSGYKTLRVLNGTAGEFSV